MAQVQDFTPYYVGQTKVFVSSSRFATKDISAIVPEIKIFENIGLPYMTAQIIIIDSSNASNAAPFIGQERVTLVIIDKELNPIITKEFICMGIEFGQKLNDGTSTYVVKLIEEHAMLNNTTRFSKVYEGKPEEITNSICEEQLGVSVDAESSYQSQMRVVFPFTITPLAAAMWMTSRCTTSTGSPFYLYSTMVDDNLQLKSLETLLNQSAFNTNDPYIFARTSDAEVGGREDYGILAKKISGYSIGNNEDTLLAMTRNVYGAYYNYVDTYELGSYEKVFDLPTPLDKLPKPNGTTEHNYDPAFSTGRPYHEGQNSYSTQITTRKLFDDGMFSYNEEEDMEKHKKKGESQALYNFMAQSPINIAVPGLELGLDRLGKMVDVYITKDIPADRDDTTKDQIKDKKRSGNYLIYAIKHVIFNNQWTSTLTVTKSDTLSALSEEDGKLNKV
jgi:hypothetical protein